MKRQRRFEPRSLELLEERVVLSVLAATGGDASSGRSTVSSFAQQVRDGLSPTLTVDFGSQATPAPAGTINVPVVPYSAGLGYGWRGAASWALGPISRLSASDGVIAGNNSDFEIDLPRGTYDVTVNLAAAATLAQGPGLELQAYTKGNQEAPNDYVSTTTPQQVTLRATVARDAPNNGLQVELNNGFAIQSIQITPVQQATARGPYLYMQAAPRTSSNVQISQSNNQISIAGTSQVAALAINNDPGNWNLNFPETTRNSNFRGLTSSKDAPPVEGAIESITAFDPNSGTGVGGDVDINTPRGQLHLFVKNPSDTGLPLSSLATPTTLAYTVQGGTGSYRGATGSGTVDVSLTPTAESVEGIVNNGVLEPTDVAGTFTLTFQPGT